MQDGQGPIQQYTRLRLVKLEQPLLGTVFDQFGCISDQAGFPSYLKAPRAEDR